MDDKLALFHFGDLFFSSFYSFGSADMFNQLVPVLLASLLILTNG